MSKVLKSKIQSFLNTFGNNVILCYNKDLNKVSSMIKCTLDEAIKQNSYGKDVYFYINEGGTKQSDITKLRACFVDLDAGRNSSGQYLTTKQVDMKKKAMIKKVKEFSLAPTYVIETRNGYQIYWILSQNHIVKYYQTKWNAIQNKINNFFKDVGSDTLTKKINQIYRLPYLNWHKKWEGKLPFNVKVYSNGKSNKYTLSELSQALNKVSGIVSKHHGDSGPYQQNKYINTCAIPVKKKKIYAEDDYSDEGWDEEITVRNQVDETVKETISFLLEVKQILWYSKKEFMSKSAERLANELSAKFCV